MVSGSAGSAKGESMLRYLCSVALALLAACATTGDDPSRLVSVDHYVRVKSTAPGFAGQDAQIYVRELARGDHGTGVVLFIHGAGTPAEVAFDVPYRDYSWMAYLAKAGYDVFAMDMTGYGRSTRPTPMNDPCTLSSDQQSQFTATTCAIPDDRVTTLESDWHDIGAVVEY